MKPARDMPYMAAVRAMRCCVGRLEPGFCSPGGVEAHHAGERPGVGLKAPDNTCIPLCRRHHAEWHAASGYFRGWDRARRRIWADDRIAETQADVRVSGEIRSAETIPW